MADGLHKTWEGLPSPAFDFGLFWRRMAETDMSDPYRFIPRPLAFETWKGRVDAAGWPTRDAPTAADA